MELNVDVKQVEGLALVGRTGSGHWVPMDTKSDVGGKDGAATPMELLLLGLCGCTAMDVISILDSMKEPCKQVSVSAVAQRAEKAPKKFTNIAVKYSFLPKSGGTVSEKNLEKAIKMSKERYCAVYASLDKDIEVVSEYEILEE